MMVFFRETKKLLDCVSINDLDRERVQHSHIAQLSFPDEQPGLTNSKTHRRGRVAASELTIKRSPPTPNWV